MVIAAWLSTRTVTLGRIMPKSAINNRKPSTICQPRAAALSSASAVENAETTCLEDLHTMILPPHVIIKPFCDFVSAPANPASVQAISSVRSPLTVMRMPCPFVEARKRRILIANSVLHAEYLEHEDARRDVK
jgi:hypothetical protein